MELVILTLRAMFRSLIASYSWFYTFTFKAEFFMEEIRVSGMLPTTYQDLLRRRIRKREEVDMEFYGTSAMIDKNWKKAQNTKWDNSH